MKMSCRKAIFILAAMSTFVASSWLIAVMIANNRASMLVLHSTTEATVPSRTTPAINQQYKMVVGILTAKRTPPSVFRMTKALVDYNSLADYKLLVRVGTSASHEKDLIQQLANLGPTIYIHNETYPDLLAKEKVRITYNHPLPRVMWRTEAVLDYAFLLERALQFNSEFILILEDDLQPAKYALDKAYELAKHINDYSNWGCIAFFSSFQRCSNSLILAANMHSAGGCALMIRRSIIPDMIMHLRKDPYDAPIDTLLYALLRQKKKIMYERTPNIFQHGSQPSSYSGKDQKYRMTERVKSVSFHYDESNHSRSLLPVKEGGYIGCFKDQAEERDFSGLFSSAKDRVLYTRSPSPTLCSYYCRHYRYFGLQAGGKCFCGNEFGQYGAAPESECNLACLGDSSKMCGGKLTNSVYKNLNRICYKTSS